MKKKLLSLALCFVMLFGVVPAGVFTVPVAAESGLTGSGTEAFPYIVTTADALREVMNHSDGRKEYIRIGSDINVMNTTGEHENPPFEQILIRGDKVLDLNGHLVKFKEAHLATEFMENYDAMENTLFNITEGSTLVIDDSPGGGEIIYDREIPDMPDSGNYVDLLLTELTVFEVNGTLITKDCEITAGHYKYQYYTSIFEGYPRDSNKHAGHVNSISSGNAVVVNDGGSFISYGGGFYGRGFLSDDKYPTKKCSAVELKNGASAVIYDGDFFGKSNANVFKVADGADIAVYGGYFSAKYDSDIPFCKMSFSGGYIECVPESNLKCGQIGIPLRAFGNVADRAGLYLDRELYTKLSDYTEEDNTAFVKYGKETKGATMWLQCEKIPAFEVVTNGGAYDGILSKDDTLTVCADTADTYYPQADEYLAQQTDIEFKWTVTDVQTKQSCTFVTDEAEINLYDNIYDKIDLIDGHSYRVNCTYTEGYHGYNSKYSLDKKSKNRVTVSYCDIELPTVSSVSGQQITERKTASESGYVKLFVTLEGVKDTTTIKVKSPFSDNIYTKTVTADGTYAVDVTDPAIALNGYKNFKITLEVTNSYGFSEESSYVRNYGMVLVPWISSSKTSAYLETFSDETLGSAQSITLKSNVPSTSAYSVQWQRCLIGDDGSWSTWEDISGATSVNYTVYGSSLTARTAYKAKVSYQTTEQSGTGCSNVIIINPTSATGEFFATAAADGDFATLEEPVTITATVDNASGSNIEYTWSFCGGPEGYYAGEISGISTASSRASFTFPNSSKSWAQNLKPGTYQITCRVRDKDAGKNFKTAPITVTVGRNVESVVVRGKNNYKYDSGDIIYMKSQNASELLKYVVTPAYADENYYISYSGYDSTVISVSNNTITAKKPGSTPLTAKVYHADGSLITLFEWNVIVPVSIFDIRLYAEPKEGQTADSVGYAYVADGLPYTVTDSYWEEDNGGFTKPVIRGSSVFTADCKYTSVLQIEPTGSYIFPVDEYFLDEYYSKYATPVDTSDLYYADTTDFEIRWHRDADNWSTCEINPENSEISAYYVVCFNYAFPILKSEHKQYLGDIRFSFVNPQPGETVALFDTDGATNIINNFVDEGYTEQVYSITTGYIRGQITDLTAGTTAETVTLQEGHRYSFNIYFKPIDADLYRFDENISVYEDGERLNDVDFLSNETLQMTYEFIPGNNNYITAEEIRSFNYGAGLTVPRLDPTATNELGGNLSAESSCRVTNIWYESSEGTNFFLSDGTFKPNTNYSAVFTLEMSDEHEANEFYDIKTITLCHTDETTGQEIKTTCSGSDITAVNKGKTAVVTVNLGNSGIIVNKLSFNPYQSETVKEGYSSNWAALNYFTFTLKNNTNTTLTNLHADYNGGSAADFTIFGQPEVSLAPGESTELKIRINDELSAGERTGLFNISFTGSNGGTYIQQAEIFLNVLARDWFYIYGDITLTDDILSQEEVNATTVSVKRPGEDYAVAYANVDAIFGNTFRLSNVPAGEYIISAERGDAPTISHSITVTEDCYVSFDFTDGSFTEGGDINGLYVSSDDMMPGGTFTATVKLPQADVPVKNLCLVVDYDENVLELVSDWSMAGLNPAFVKTDISNRPGFTLNAPDDTVLGGTEFTATFRVKEDAAVGVTDLVIGDLYTLYTDSEGADASLYDKPDNIRKRASVQITRGGTSGVSGTVYSFGHANLNTTVKLFDSERRSVYKTVSASGEIVHYDLMGVNAGNYCLVASKPGYATRYWPVTVEENAVNADIEIDLLGDVVCDGEFTAADYSAAVNIALSDENCVTFDQRNFKEYKSAIADMDEDGCVDVLDIVLLERVVQGY